MKPTTNIFAFALVCCFATCRAYTVSLFTGQGCDYDDLGLECVDIESLECCVAPEGELFLSVGQDGNWGYSIQNGDRCGVILGSGEGCFSADNGLEAISGGSVSGILPDGTTANKQAPKTVTADTWFYRNETTKYTISMDSELGRQLSSVKDRDRRAALLTSHGEAADTI